jgi:hypothetical protein
MVTAPWCGACKSVHPIIDQVGEAYREKGVQTLFLAPLEGDTSTKTAAHAVERYRRLMRMGDTASIATAIVEGPMKVSAEGVPSWSYASTFSQYHVDGFPSMYVVDSHGIIRGVWCGGPRNLADMMKETLDRVLASVKPKAPAATPAATPVASR